MTNRDKVIHLFDCIGLEYDLDSNNKTIWIEGHHCKVSGLTEYTSIAFNFTEDDSEDFKGLVLEEN